MKKFSLPRKTLYLWQLRIAFLGLILIILASFLIKFPVIYILLLGIFIIFTLFFVFWFLPKYFLSYEILYSEGAIIVNRGVFIKTSHIMPFSRLVYTESFSSPLAKQFGLSTICLKAVRSSIFIPEIDVNDVKAFVSLLTQEENI